jgi:hypothetical protein
MRFSTQQFAAAASCASKAFLIFSTWLKRLIGSHGRTVLD